MNNMCVITLLGILTGATAANADFTLNGAIEMGGGAIAGGLGSSLTWDGEANWGPFGGQWFGPSFTNTGFQFQGSGPTIQPSILEGSEMNSDGFKGAVFFGGAGIPSGEFDLGGGFVTAAIQLMHFDAGLSNIRLANDAPEGGQNGMAYVQIDSVPQFVGFNMKNPNGYGLVLTDFEPTGGQILWLAYVPTPGAAGLLGLAGLAAVRRRR